MATKTKSSNEKNGVGKSPCVGSVLNRALTSNSQWPDKDEFLDVIYWGRQVLGIVLGLVWGFIPLKGFIGLFLSRVVTYIDKELPYSFSEFAKFLGNKSPKLSGLPSQ